MSQVSPEQLQRLSAAVASEEYLRRVADEIERLHRVVFHDNVRADWSRVRYSAEQILIAAILSRHQGDPLGVYYALRALEDAGRPWDAAIAELAAAIHSYYTTPLGIVMRRDMFGENAVFFSPDAGDWSAQASGGRGTP